MLLNDISRKKLPFYSLYSGYISRIRDATVIQKAEKQVLTGKGREKQNLPPGTFPWVTVEQVPSQHVYMGHLILHNESRFCSMSPNDSTPRRNPPRPKTTVGEIYDSIFGLAIENITTYIFEHFRGWPLSTRYP